MKKKTLIWVYPKNNWKANVNKTFIYGWAKPKSKLFVEVKNTDLRKIYKKEIKLYPNGNFAEVIQLFPLENEVKVVQNKKNILKRKVYVSKEKNKNVKTKFSKKFIPCVKINSIVIDPGHGGSEHGTHSTKGIAEKHYNLQIAKLLYPKLKKHFKKTYLTRSSDKFLSLDKRIDFAKKKKCNLFISIHHNALPDNKNPNKHRGVGIYYTHDSLKPFANELLINISKNANLKKYGLFKRNFRVTKQDFYNGILIECGFLIHPIESEYIIKKSIQEKIANAIVNTIVE